MGSVASITVVKNRRGEWVPAIPLPIYRLWMKQCPNCGERFYTTDGYRGHYAIKHILDPVDGDA